jgi:hypothetical protein
MLCSSSSVLQRNVTRPTYVHHDKTTSAQCTMPKYSIITLLSHPAPSSPLSPVSASSCIDHSHCSLLTHTPFLYPYPISTAQKCPPFPSTTLNHPNLTIGPFHRLCPSPDAAAPVGDIRSALSPITSEGSFPHG